MNSQPTLNHQEAFEKYFGNALYLSKATYPWKCKFCDFLLLHVDGDWEAHVREIHNEKVMSQKQIDSIEKRRKQRELEKRI